MGDTLDGPVTEIRMNEPVADYSRLEYETGKLGGMVARDIDGSLYTLIGRDGQRAASIRKHKLNE